MRSFSLHEAFVKQARDSTRQGALRKLVGASWSAQVALRKLHCASCSAQVAPRKLLRQVGSCKWLPASCSVQIAPCKLLCASCSAQVALRKFLCASCSAQVALGKALCANWSVQIGLRKLLCATCSAAQVALIRKLHLATPARRPGRNRTRDPPVPGAGARTTGQLPRTSSNNKRRKKHRVFAPQRVARAPQKSQKTMGFCTSTTPIPAEGRASTAEIAKKNMDFCTSTTPIPAEGRASTAEIAKNHEFLHLDHADPRRGPRGNFRNRQKPRFFAPRPRRSPQRVAREL